MREIEDEIIELEDIGDFIDYKIKNYYEGMKVRIELEIQKEVEGEIIIIEEVIGEGDEELMNKEKERIMNMVEKDEIMVIERNEIEKVSKI